MFPRSLKKEEIITSVGRERIYKNAILFFFFFLLVSLVISQSDQDTDTGRIEDVTNFLPNFCELLPFGHMKTKKKTLKKPFFCVLHLVRFRITLNRSLDQTMSTHLQLLIYLIIFL